MTLHPSFEHQMIFASQLKSTYPKVCGVRGAVLNTGDADGKLSVELGTTMHLGRDLRLPNEESKTAGASTKAEWRLSYVRSAPENDLPIAIRTISTDWLLLQARS